MLQQVFIEHILLATLSGKAVCRGKQAKLCPTKLKCQEQRYRLNDQLHNYPVATSDRMRERYRVWTSLKKSLEAKIWISRRLP